MILAVDIGTSEFRSLARVGRKLVGRRCAACYIAIPDDPVTERWVDRMNVASIACETGRVVLGETAVDLARVLRVPLIPLLWDGSVPKSDPVGRQLVALGIQSLIPDRKRVEEVLLILPGNEVDGDSPNVAFLTRLLRAPGRTIQLAHSGTATAFAGLERHQYTGLTINLGAGHCASSLVRHGQPLIEMTMPGGGRGLNERLARQRGLFFYDDKGQRYLDLAGVESWKRTVDLRSDLRGNPDLSVLKDLYHESAVAIARKLELELTGSRHAGRMGAGVAVALAGGAATMGGFDSLLKTALGEVKLPFSLGRIELCPHDSFALVRGLLVAREHGNRGLLKRAA